MKLAAFVVSTAIALTLTCATPAAAQRLRLPAARAPAGLIFSPQAVASDLRHRGYRVQSMRRLGTVYSVYATGPRGNRVQMLVDGRSGEVIGLAVIRAAPNMAAAVAQVMRGPPQARFTDDAHPFGIIVPDRYERGWATVPRAMLAPAASANASRYARAPNMNNGNGYRFAVPARSVRPGRGGFSRSTIPASRMRQPLYQVYSADGQLMQMAAAANERAMLAQLEAEDARSTAEDLAEENRYLGNALDGADLDEPSDYDLEDGDNQIADNGDDNYGGGFSEDNYGGLSEENPENLSGAANEGCPDGVEGCDPETWGTDDPSANGGENPDNCAPGDECGEQPGDEPNANGGDDPNDPNANGGDDPNDPNANGGDQPDGPGGEAPEEPDPTPDEPDDPDPPADGPDADPS